MSTTTPTATATPSTTYPYSYTTFTNPSPSPFTTPTLIPSIFRWGSVESCRASSTASASASASPSNAPLARPDSNRAGGCTISNEAGINDHAFWDMYACCESGNMGSLGSPLPCTAVCWADGAQSFLDLGRCLSERVEVVVCSPPEEERGEEPEGSSSGSASATSTSAGETQSQTESASGSASGADATGSASASTGAASAVGGVYVGSTKTGLVVFGLMALSSAAGMFL